jgi:hypothetical protein
MRSILITAPMLIAGIAIATSAAAQQLPLPKSGGCPPGFRESGGYCFAGEDTRTLDDVGAFWSPEGTKVPSGEYKIAD